MLELTGAMLQPICGIYEIRNTQTGQCYIGQSKHIPARWASHFAALGKGKHSLLLLQRDWDQYTPDTFRASVIKIVDDEADLLAEEASIALSYLDAGTKLYNAAIAGWFNEEEGAAQTARAMVAAMRERQVLQRKRAKENETRNQERGNSGNIGSLRTEGGIQSDRGISRDSPGAPVESDKRWVCEPEVGLLPGKQRIDSEARTERPAPQSMDEDGQRRDSYQDDREILPIFDRYAASVLTDHLPDEEKEEYLQTLISDTLFVTGGSAIDIALIIQAAFSKEDVLEAWHVLDPNTVSIFFNATDEEYAKIRAAADSHPGGLVEWLMERTP